MWSPDGNFQAAYDDAGGTATEAFAAWDAEVAHARRIVRAAASLDVTGVDRPTGEEYSLRRVLVHLVQEYARHNGHADLIRESVDGLVGEDPTDSPYPYEPPPSLGRP